MLVYDITNEKSFDNIKNWIRNIEEHASADVEKMILGNKCDMNDRRQVCNLIATFANIYCIRLTPPPRKKYRIAHVCHNRSIKLSILIGIERTW